MLNSEKTPGNQPQKNQKTNEELLRLLRAYRKKEHSREKPSQEQNDLTVALYNFIDRLAGIDRKAVGPDHRNKVGSLAVSCGVSDRAEELADRMQIRIENNAKDDGGYLAGWTEDGGMSIATYIWNMGKRIAQEMGRETVEEAIRARSPIRKKRSDAALGEEKDEETGEDAKAAEDAIRKDANRRIAERQRAKKDDPTSLAPDLPSIETKSFSDYEPNDGHRSGEAPPTAMPKEVITSIETPLASALRVRPLLANLRVVGNDMQGKAVVVNGRRTVLTVNHRNIWFAFLALTPEQHQHLGDSIEELAEKNGWHKSSAKRYLAAGFVFFQEHRLFETCCDLLLSNRASKHMDDTQLTEARANAKKLLMGEVPRQNAMGEEEENARDLFRKTIHQWIEKYGTA